MKILFALASPIIRPNGIVTFLTESATILRSLGHTVDLITDAEPSVNLDDWFDDIYYDPWHTAEYPHEMKDGNPHIRFTPHIQNRINRTYHDEAGLYDVIISNDAQSTAAFLDSPKAATKLVHYIHTGALLGPNHTFLSDSYVQLEREITGYCEVAGQHQTTIRNAAGKDGHVIHLPLKKDLFLPRKDEEKSGLMFIGEGRVGKGADKYIAACNTLGVQGKVMASYGHEMFTEIDLHYVQSFAPHQLERKAAFVRSAKAGYHPSPCECWPYSVMEMLLSMPVVVPAECKWAEPLTEIGALVVPEDKVLDTLQEIMEPGYQYDNTPIIKYLSEAENTWIEFLKTV